MKMKLAGKKIVIVLIIISLSFSMVSWQNFFNIFAAVATYGRTDDSVWSYKVLNAAGRTVSIRPLDLGEFESSKVTIPSSVIIQGDSYTVTEIASYAYSQCFCADCLKKNKMNLSTAWEDQNESYEGEELEIEISELVIPSTITEIAVNAFEFCDLSKITFEKNSRLEIIGESAFSDCTLKTITIPKSVTTIEGYAFSYSSLQTITFEEGSKIEEIEDGTFEESGLRNITLPNTITSIGEMAFLSCRLTTITIPESVTIIAANAFEENTRLKEVIFAADGDLEEIQIGAFMGCGLTEVTIPASVEKVEVCAFGNNSDLETVTFETASAIDKLNTNAFAKVSGYDYEQDYIEDMEYKKNTSVSQVNVKNYDVYQWIMKGELFSDSTKIYSEKTRVFLEEEKEENVQENITMKGDNQATIHIDNYVLANQGYHFEGSQFIYSDTLNSKQNKTGDIEGTDFISHGYPYVVIKANQEANEYGIAYNTNGGTAIESTGCRYNEPITISSNIPIRKGYEFIGWSRDASGEGKIYQPGEVVNENFTDADGAVVPLYAVWKEITKKVTIHFSTPEKISDKYGYEILVTRNGNTIQQHDVPSSQVGDKKIIISGAKIGDIYVIKCTNYEKENGKKKYYQTTTKQVTIE